MKMMGDQHHNQYPSLTKLNHLNLAFNNVITNEGITALTNLTILNLVHNESITIDAVLTLPLLSVLYMKDGYVAEEALTKKGVVVRDTHSY